MTRFTRAQLLEDVAFLERRARIAGAYRMDERRDYGLSSNALVRFAYTGEEPRHLPSDHADLGACARALASLPAHRRTQGVDDWYRKGERAVKAKYGDPA